MQGGTLCCSDAAPCAPLSHPLAHPHPLLPGALVQRCTWQGPLASRACWGFLVLGPGWRWGAGGGFLDSGSVWQVVPAAFTRDRLVDVSDSTFGLFESTSPRC